MRVFISWSGEVSRQIAEVLRDWLPSVLQSTKPYFSGEDIEKGTRWLSDISENLKESKVCLLVLTPDNLSSIWMNFEAGAASTSFEKSRICPLLFNLRPEQVSFPLAMFQSTALEHTEYSKLLRSLNAMLGEDGLAPGVLDKVFEKWWPDFEKSVQSILKDHPQKLKKADEPTEKEQIREILIRLRSMEDARPLTRDMVPSKNLIANLEVLSEQIIAFSPGKSGWKHYGEILIYVMRHVDLIARTSRRSIDDINFLAVRSILSALERRIAIAKKEEEEEIPF